MFNFYFFLLFLTKTKINAFFGVHHMVVGWWPYFSFCQVVLCGFVLFWHNSFFFIISFMDWMLRLNKINIASQRMMCSACMHLRFWNLSEIFRFDFYRNWKHSQHSFSALKWISWFDAEPCGWLVCFRETIKDTNVIAIKAS